MHIRDFLQASFRRDAANRSAPSASGVNSDNTSGAQTTSDGIQWFLTSLEIFEVGGLGGATSYATATGGVIAFGYVTIIAGAALAVYGVFAAVGGGYLEAREEVERDRFESGFSRGFVAGLQNWKGRHVREYLRYSHSHNVVDANLSIYARKAYIAGLVYGYSKGATLSPAAKKRYLNELRQFAGRAINQSDIQGRVDRVIELAAKLRKHYQPLKILDQAMLKEAASRIPMG